MELRHRAPARLRRALAALAAVLAATLLAVPPAAAAPELKQPRSQTTPPAGYDRSAREVIGIAGRAHKVRQERAARGRLRPTAYTRGPGRWQVSFFDRDEEAVQVRIDDRTGAILEQWRGPQVAWSMARGYEGAFGRKLNAPYVWIPLCVLFLAPFIDPRRPFRLLHLDLLVLLAFGVSHVFFNAGEIGISVPLVYPVLLYLLVRLLFAAFRPREGSGPLIPYAPATVLLVGIVFLATFRIALNVLDSNVIDVGYAGVIGADRIVDGDPLYGAGFSDDVERGDTYGPLTYLLYVPFEQAIPWTGAWDDLPAAHGAAIAFDLLAAGGLLLFGWRLQGRMLGLALAWAWLAYPYTAFALESNSNDTLVAVACVGALLALTLARGRSVAAGLAVGLGAAAKFAPLVLLPLLGGRRVRSAFLCVLTAAAVLCLVFLPFLPEGGVRELYDRTVGYQAARPSPFSIWGQEPSLAWLQTAVKALAVGFGLLVGFVPRTRDPRTVAALGGAVLIGLQLAVTHWFYLYVVWFVPFVFVALIAGSRESGARSRKTPDERAVVTA